MSEHEDPAYQLFRERLNWLFANVKRSDGKLYTSSDIARMSGLTVQLVTEYRRGLRTNPTLSTLIALARTFGVPLGYFFSTKDQSSLEYELLKNERQDLLELTLRASQLTPQAVRQIVEVINIFHITTSTPEEHSPHEAEGEKH